MVKNMKRNGRKRSRAAMTIVETGFAIVIGLVVIAGAIAAYKKMYVPMKGDAAYTQISSVISALERVKMTNNSVYPYETQAKINTADDTATDGFTMIENELGGAGNSFDVGNWEYGCSAQSSGATVTIKTTAYDNQTVADIAAAKVSNALAPWAADSLTAADGTVTMTLENVTCN